MIGSLLHMLLLAFAAGPDDRVLAERIRQGDAAAFRSFFDRHHGTLYRYLRRRGVPDPVCEDLVQNAFVTVWERRAAVDPDRSLRALLFRIGYTRALNHFRDTARFDGDAALASSAAANATDRQAAQSLLDDAVRLAVNALPERRRAVFELCFFEELTYAEAADALGISAKTVENQMGHALKALRRALRPYVQDEPR